MFFAKPRTAFFIATQVLYTGGFLLLVLICTGIVAVQQCFIIEREDYVLRALSIASSLAALCCTSAVAIFALNGNQEDWMPDPEHNYFSWSFVAAVIGSFLLWIAALLFYIEMQLTVRRGSRQRGSHSHSSRWSSTYTHWSQINNILLKQYMTLDWASILDCCSTYLIIMFCHKCIS